MSKYKPYPKYKDSGVEWLGQVPEGWKVLAIKKIVSTPVTDGPHTTPEILDEGIPFISAEAIGEGYINFDKMRGYISREDHILFSKKYKPKREDIYLVKSGATTGVSAIVKTDIEFNIWSPLAAIRCEKSIVLPDYMFQYVRSKEFIAAIELYWNYGTQQNIGMGVIENLYAPIPSMPEQQAIAAFLDRETAHIDTLICKQQRLIELLQEKRQALISHVVTKGLNPDVPMKDSGVEWLGKIPKHWQTKRVKYLFAIKKRIVGTLGFDILSITQQGIVIKDIEANTGQFSMDYSKYQLVDQGDFAMNHMDLLTGFVDISNYLGVTSPDYRVFSSIDKNNYSPLYSLYLFQNAYLNKIFYALGQGVSNFGRWRLPTEQFNNFILPIPPREEQQAIVDFLEDERSKIDALIAKAQHAIALAQEHRDALISAAVTGKICVPQGQTEEQPLSQTQEYFLKAVLTAMLIDRLYQEQTFGRIKLQKMLHLCEYHAQLPFRQSDYQRYHAGPLDPKMIYPIEARLKKLNWFSANETEKGKKVDYTPLEKREEYKQHYLRSFAEQRAAIENILELFQDKDSPFCQNVSTAYGAWNDFLLNGLSPTDDEIIHDIRTNWAPEKQAIPESDWRFALAWMREHKVIPTGWGKPIRQRPQP